jgi:hypothetical protein
MPAASMHNNYNIVVSRTKEKYNIVGEVGERPPQG